MTKENEQTSQEEQARQDELRTGNLLRRAFWAKFEADYKGISEKEILEEVASFLEVEVEDLPEMIDAWSKERLRRRGPGKLDEAEYRKRIVRDYPVPQESQG